MKRFTAPPEGFVPWVPKKDDPWPVYFLARRRGDSDWLEYPANWFHHFAHNGSPMFVTGFAAIYAGNYEFIVPSPPPVTEEQCR